eukprot:g69534.t1
MSASDLASKVISSKILTIQEGTLLLSVVLLMDSKKDTQSSWRNEIKAGTLLNTDQPDVDQLLAKAALDQHTMGWFALPKRRRRPIGPEFKWSSSMTSLNMSLDDTRKIARVERPTGPRPSRRNQQNQWALAIANPLMQDGAYEWEVQFNQLHTSTSASQNSCFMRVGIVPGSFTQSSLGVGSLFADSPSRGYAISGSGSLQNDNQSTRVRPFLEHPVTNGTILGFRLSIQDRTLEVFQDRKYVGVAFTGLDASTGFRPVVAFSAQYAASATLLQVASGLGEDFTEDTASSSFLRGLS